MKQYSVATYSWTHWVGSIPQPGSLVTNWPVQRALVSKAGDIYSCLRCLRVVSWTPVNSKRHSAGCYGMISSNFRSCHQVPPSKGALFDALLSQLSNKRSWYFYLCSVNTTSGPRPHCSSYTSRTSHERSPKVLCQGQTGQASLGSTHVPPNEHPRRESRRGWLFRFLRVFDGDFNALAYEESIYPKRCRVCVLFCL